MMEGEPQAPSRAARNPDSMKVLLKIIIIGDSGVGKSSLLLQYVNKTFVHKYQATIGTDFLTKDLELEGHRITLQIWDTAGQERFSSSSLGSAFYRGADACILVYDITDAKSFNKLAQFKEDFVQKAHIESDESFPFLLIGNKNDLAEERVVKAEQASSWCKNQVPPIQYIETSAKLDVNVEKAFEHITVETLHRRSIENESFEQTPVNTEVIRLAPSEKEKSGCAC
ncbi:Ras-related protein Rab-7A [Balamuthia mandrillaris]